MPLRELLKQSHFGVKIATSQGLLAMTGMGVITFWGKEGVCGIIKYNFWCIELQKHYGKS